MLRMILGLALLLAVTRIAHANTNSDDDARKFLEGIAASDYAGDASPRIGHVLRGQRSSAKEDAAAGPAFEVYDLDSDSLVVVTDWKFIALERRSASKVCAKFAFTVVAKSIGKGLPSWMSAKARHIQALQQAKGETRVYCAQFNEGKWMLIDAPVPRVGKEQLIAFMHDRTERAAKIASEISNGDPRAKTNAERIANSLKEQLAVLLPL